VTVQGVAVDQHDRLAGAVVLVVEVDGGAVLLPYGDEWHLAFPFGLRRTIVLRYRGERAFSQSYSGA
jgi:hypothetical protein